VPAEFETVFTLMTPFCCTNEKRKFTWSVLVWIAYKVMLMSDHFFCHWLANNNQKTSMPLGMIQEASR
jgi:hypothetical protein